MNIGIYVINYYLVNITTSTSVININTILLLCFFFYYYYYNLFILILIPRYILHNYIVFARSTPTYNYNTNSFNN